MIFSLDPGPIERYAVRILFILNFCGDGKENGQQLSLFEDPNTDQYAAFIDSETKVQKIDFWLRYPDHLSAALIKGCESGGNLEKRKSEIKDVIRSIFLKEEPQIRWIPMLKYLRGAYEPLDDVMAFLSSRRLASRKVLEKGHRIKYYLTNKGSQAVKEILQWCEESSWYAERCQLINSFFEHLNGFEIREMQYLEGNYANTPMLKMIEQIDHEVRNRFEITFGEPL